MPRTPVRVNLAGHFVHNIELVFAQPRLRC
jgi:hypothetical protein